jgi:hypothetical protein
MGLLELDLSGSGTLIDLGEVDRSFSRQKNLEFQLGETRRRMEAEKDPAAKKSYQQALAQFEEQLKGLREADLKGKAKGGRTARLTVQYLDETVDSDPALKAEVEKIQPPS